MSDETKEQGEDLSSEHPVHFEKIPTRCYECYKESMTAEDKNNAQMKNLADLKASIEAKQELRKQEQEQKVELRIKEFIEVPIITIEGKSEFDLDRHTQLCKKVDVLYNNYLVSIENFQFATKEFTQTYEELITEGLKVRWNS